ncbi:MAG: lytic transglycosylase domain-containing protein [Thermoanaerobaculia bacterium]
MPRSWVRWADRLPGVRGARPLAGARPASQLFFLLIGFFLAGSPSSGVVAEGARPDRTAGERVATAAFPAAGARIPTAALVSKPLALSVTAPLALGTNRSAGEFLSEARRLARLPVAGEDPFRGLTADGLWSVRARLARVTAALSRPDPRTARAELAGSDGSPLQLPDLVRFLRLSVERLESSEDSPSLTVAHLVEFASTSTSEPLARAALKAASRRARTEPDRRSVREGWERWAVTAPTTPRALVARFVGMSDLAPGRKEALASLVELIRILPDAPERAADLFDAQERELLDTAARSASGPVRLARARALGVRKAAEALDLIRDLTVTNENRVAIAQIYLDAARAREALTLLDSSELARLGDTADGRHASVLAAIARTRLFESRTATGTASTVAASPRRGRRRAQRQGRAAPRGRKPLPLRGTSALARVEASASSEAVSSLIDQLLGRSLSEADRKRLLTEGLRFSLQLGRHDDARGYLVQLLAIDPMTSAGAEDFFAEAFSAYQRSRLAGSSRTAELLRAGRLWDEQGALYRDVSVRRRATYWSAKAHAAAGELPAARSLYAGLLVGTSADLYARWAADALGVPLLPSSLQTTQDEPDESLSAEQPGLASRELLACGLPEIAEDAAETESSLDPLFGAALASERGDYRRATSLLKSRYPALGTPEEGGVPLSVRRAFYPLLHSELLVAAATRNGVSAPLLFGLIRQESLFQPLVRSHAGAVGLMQVMPATGRFLLRLEKRRGSVDLTDPKENVTLGARYLAQLLAQFDGDAGAALAAYNAGPGRVRRWKREGGSLPADEFIESIPLSEPRDYVKKVLFFQGAYSSLYARAGSPLPAELSPATLSE